MPKKTALNDLSDASAMLRAARIRLGSWSAVRTYYGKYSVRTYQRYGENSGWTMPRAIAERIVLKGTPVIASSLDTIRRSESRKRQPRSSIEVAKSTGQVFRMDKDDSDFDTNDEFMLMLLELWKEYRIQLAPQDWEPMVEMDTIGVDDDIREYEEGE